MNVEKEEKEEKKEEEEDKYATEIVFRPQT